MNESPAYVCPTSLLLMIATKLPKNADEMHIMYNPLPQYVQPDLISDNGIENILTVIQNSLQEYQESTMKSITIVNETISIENSPLSTLNEVEKNKEDHELNNLIQSEVSIPTPSTQSQEPDTPTPALKPDTPIPSLQVPDTPNPISQEPDTPTASSSSKEIVPEKSQALTSFPHLTVLKVFGVVLTFRIFGYFLGIPPLPIVRNIFPSFFSWTLRLRANMKRL